MSLSAGDHCCSAAPSAWSRGQQNVFVNCSRNLSVARTRAIETFGRRIAIVGARLLLDLRASLEFGARITASVTLTSSTDHSNRVRQSNLASPIMPYSEESIGQARQDVAQSTHLMNSLPTYLTVRLGNLVSGIVIRGYARTLISVELKPFL
jgi:hypothetical protein